MNADDFANSLNGESIEDATECFLDEIVNFSRPAKRKVLAKLLDISRAYRKKAGEELDKILESDCLEEEIQDGLSKLSGNAAETSEA